MKEELKPCPICGSFNIAVTPTRIMCCPCGVAVHADDGYQINDFYFDRWNALPRRLKWTKEHPTGPGIYFYRKNPDALFTVIGVFEERDRTLCFTMLGSKKQRTLEYTTGEWAGPIPEPMEAD